MMDEATRLPVRKSPRLAGYDYTWPGAYYLTICTHHRELLFGRVINGEMRPNRCGAVVAQAWHALPDRFPSLDLDAFVVMPNHVHGVVLVGLPNPGVASRQASLPVDSSLPSLSRVMRAFKSISAIAVNRELGRSGQPVWQRSFHDRIVRDERELERIRAYIAANPATWEHDRAYRA